MDLSQRSTPAAVAAQVVAIPPALTVEQATLFMTDFSGSAVQWEALLAQSLARLHVHARHSRVVSLLEQPLLGRACHVRVTPCLVLDTGSRLIRIPDDPLKLNQAVLEAALLQA